MYCSISEFSHSVLGILHLDSFKKKCPRISISRKAKDILKKQQLFYRPILSGLTCKPNKFYSKVQSDDIDGFFSNRGKVFFEHCQSLHVLFWWSQEIINLPQIFSYLETWPFFFWDAVMMFNLRLNQSCACCAEIDPANWFTKYSALSHISTNIWQNNWHWYFYHVCNMDRWFFF